MSVKETMRYVAGSAAIVAYSGISREVSMLAVRAAGKIADPEKERKEWAISMVASLACLGTGLLSREFSAPLAIGACGAGAVGLLRSVVDMFDDVNGRLDPNASYFPLLSSDYRSLVTSR
jgi:hypothetical protein